MTVFTKIIVVISVVACGFLVVLAWAWMRGGRNYAGYFAPVYSPDGQYVYFVERQTSGTTKATSSWDFFLSSTKFDVSVTKDTFNLKRVHIQTGRVEELNRFSPSPIEGRHYETIGSPFHVPAARLRFAKEQQLEFDICLTVNEVPTAKEYFTSGVWNEAQHAANISKSWENSPCQISGYNESPLFSDWEVMEVDGRNSFPAAIVAYNHVTNELKVLMKNAEYTSLYPRGVPLQQVVAASRRTAIEHQHALLRTYDELLQKYKAMGMTEVQAMLHTTKDLQRLGYYPKTTTIAARKLNQDETAKAALDKDALFSIAKAEMESGIFPDIEKAIASPGEEIDKSDGYFIHRDYTTSARLNAFLQTGNTRFYVRYLGVTYELTITKPK